MLRYETNKYFLTAHTSHNTTLQVKYLVLNVPVLSMCSSCVSPIRPCLLRRCANGLVGIRPVPAAGPKIENIFLHLTVRPTVLSLKTRYQFYRTYKEWKLCF